MKKVFLFLKKLFWLLAAVGMAALLLPRLATAIHGWLRTYSVAEAPARPAAIVFGAGLWRDGTPSPVLRDRVNAAAELYFAGKVEKLLMSGDNSTAYYNEPEAMRRYAIGLGVPDEAIALDYAGRRTYDTCYRARHIFGLEEVILVTQSFHLPRALFTCHSLGVDSIGVSADLRSYRLSAMLYWHVRELGATLSAFLDVFVLRPLPILGQPEPIFSHELRGTDATR